MNCPVEYLLPCIWRMETFRYAFTHTKSPLDHMGEQAGLHRIAERAYQMVIEDFILQRYFKKADTPAQVVKFARLITQMIRFQETPTNVMEAMRHKHKMYDIQNKAGLI